MKIEIAKYLNNARGGFTFVFDDACYRASTLKTVEIFKKIEADTGVKIKATSAQTVSFLSEEMIELWKELIKEGYYDIASHSVGHDVCFNEQTPKDVLIKDAVESKNALEKIYGKAPICYVTPNGGHTKEGWAVLEDIYYANRNGEEYESDPDTIDFYNIGAFIARLAYDSDKYIEHIDSLVKNGTYAIQINHWITEKSEDTFHAQSIKTFIDECEYLSALVRENKIWVATMNEAVKYFYERKNAQISTQGDNITVTHSLDKSVFDMPLTLVISTEESKRVLINGAEFELSAEHENIVTIQI